MSIELPEARILAQQLDDTIKGKTIKSYDLKDVGRMMKIGFVNKNLADFEEIIGKTVIGAVSSGNTIRLQLSGSMNLLIAPEYGGILTYLQEDQKPPKHHLLLGFTDGTQLTTRITSMGVIYAVDDAHLSENYMYKRDFLSGVSPDSSDFTWEWFKETMEGENRQPKSVLVGKDAHIIGLSNAAFQDILYRAGVHPKRKVSNLSETELRALYDAIKSVIDERLKQKGKDQFTDIFGVQGGYTPAMGPNMKDQRCPRCGISIQKIAHGGGSVYLCPECQPE